MARARRKIAAIAVLAALVGAIVGKFVIKRDYLSTATLLWEPPTAGRTDAAREITTLAASVKLPQNLLKVREALKLDVKMEKLAANIDVTVGSSSMLLSIKARANSADASAQLANATVDAFLESQRRLSETRLREVATALRQSLGQSESALGAARAKYAKFADANGVANFTEEQRAIVEETARLQAAVNDAQVELKGIEARENSLRKSRSESPATVEMTRNEQNVDRARAAQLESDLAQAQARHPDSHPTVQALKAQVEAAKARSVGNDTITSRTIGRNSVRDALASEAESSAASRRAQSRKFEQLEQLQKEAAARARQLSAAEGEAVRLLSDVKAQEEHVDLLLKQIAMAEDDVRNASSNFQIVSAALPPEHSERSMGRIIAIATPVLASLIALLVVVLREVASLRVKTGQEAAYWAKAPVLCSALWPAGGPAEASEIARECSDILVGRAGVLGVTAPVHAEQAEMLANVVARRLKKRGVSCVVRPALKLSRRNSAEALSDFFESAVFGRAVARARKQHSLLLLILPPLTERSALRAVQRWLDGTVVVLESGEAKIPFLASLGVTLDREQRGLSLVVTRDELSGHAARVGNVDLAFQTSLPSDEEAPVRAKRPRKGDAKSPRRKPASGGAARAGRGAAVAK